jgi:hypothetical protein
MVHGLPGVEAVGCFKCLSVDPELMLISLVPAVESPSRENLGWKQTARETSSQASAFEVLRRPFRLPSREYQGRVIGSIQQSNCILEKD